MTIIQFSPGRSGSTLVWNILNELYGNGRNSIQKKHTLPKGKINTTDKMVCTIRDPRDMLRSRLLAYNKTANNIDNIDTEIDLMIKFGLKDILRIRDYDNVLVLKYELFWNNYNYIYDNIETFLGVNIDSDKRKQITEKFNVKKMNIISDRITNFSKYDKKTQIHGDHISSTKGEPNHWEKSIPQKFHDHINKRLGVYITTFGYLM